jgi:hypothetical protein
MIRTTETLTYVCFAPKATELPRGNEMTLRANSDRTADKLGSRSGRGRHQHRCVSPRTLAVSAWVQTYIV